MNITTEAGRNIKKYFNSTSNEVFSDVVLDSYNRQIYLFDEFKKKMMNILDETEFAYPNDAEKLQKLTDEYVRSASRISKVYMNKLFEQTNKPSSLFKSKNSSPFDIQVKLNVKWAKEWLQQTGEMKNTSDISFSSRFEKKDSFFNWWEND